MKISVFGIGYVGLVQAAALAEVGHDVLCVDIDAARVEALEQGIIPIYEPGLERLVVENHGAGRLRFTADPEEGVQHGYVQIIAVGTPPMEDGSANTRYVMAVAGAIGRAMTSEKIVVSKSTVPVGTCDEIHETITAELDRRALRALGFHVVSNPEFLKEGSAVSDCMKPDRIIIGTDSADAEAVMRELYAPFNRNHEKMIFMDVRSAELTKYAANCMLATKISFMNEMASIAHLLGADIEQVRLGIGSDPRIGYDFIYPGIGYGGSCFPKDVRALIATAAKAGAEVNILKAVNQRNDAQKRLLFELVQQRFEGQLSDKTFAVWGLAFKPNTNDMREAPARVLLEALWDAGARVRAYDPQAMNECARIYGERPELVFCDTKEHALCGADALIIATEWKSFRAPDFALVRKALRTPIIFDGRNLYNAKQVAVHGLEYRSIGRPETIP
ncbi:UDPglucose 6-dehydrogenase [Nitratireductor aquibiodomus]|uniref:UDP-glucose 6-dehydrogenase n=1 Tax=Nitratireductor aquibiodomus TaxID=204799 RepID=A0A1H4MJ07_9HYPH|nr:UDP-glucose/GDP-mannose dehydrogenase family protein [Nitratireductor aquibiodomus]SEB82923.1 UDPglucose 6-dehydrogenase [Nitratireductor aquibiodomus]